MAEGVTVLRSLLVERHLQTHSAFVREYDRAAAVLDRDLVGSWPSRAQLHRWLTGSLVGLPYAHHCRVLEAMFPGPLAAGNVTRPYGARSGSLGSGSPNTA